MRGTQQLLLMHRVQTQEQSFHNSVSHIQTVFVKVK